MKKTTITKRVTVKRWIITISSCLVIFTAFAGYKFNEINTAIEEQAVLPEYFETVEVFAAETVEHVPTVKTLGVALAQQQVTLRNELPGYITQVNFKSGAVVKKGQVIIQLDVSEQEANLDSARARAELAKTVYDRDVELHDSNAVSKESVDRSRAELKVIKAEIAAIKSIINRKTIRAPFGGVIGIHQFESGQYLDANTLITTLVAHSDEMWIDFSVPQFYGELNIGTLVRAQLVRSQSSAPNPYFEAQIIAGNSLISSEARSRMYRAVVNGEHPALLHNASVEVEVPVGPRRSLVAVPSQSVQSSVHGQYVFALDPESDTEFYRARALLVSIELEEDDRSYVSGDLQADRLVAAAGAFKLRGGVLVQAKTRPTVGAATGGQ